MKNSSFRTSQCMLDSLVYPQDKIKNYISKDIDNCVWLKTCKIVRDIIWIKVGRNIYNEQSEN